MDVHKHWCNMRPLGLHLPILLVIMVCMCLFLDQGAADEKSKVFISYKELVSHAASLISTHEQKTTSDQSPQYHIQKM